MRSLLQFLKTCDFAYIDYSTIRKGTTYANPLTIFMFMPIYTGRMMNFTVDDTINYVKDYFDLKDSQIRKTKSKNDVEQIVITIANIDRNVDIVKKALCYCGYTLVTSEKDIKSTKFIDLEFVKKDLATYNLSTEYKYDLGEYVSKFFDGHIPDYIKDCSYTHYYIKDGASAATMLSIKDIDYVHDYAIANGFADVNDDKIESVYLYLTTLEYEQLLNNFIIINSQQGVEVHLKPSDNCDVLVQFAIPSHDKKFHIYKKDNRYFILNTMYGNLFVVKKHKKNNKIYWSKLSHESYNTNR